MMARVKIANVLRLNVFSEKIRIVLVIDSIDSLYNLCLILKMEYQNLLKKFPIITDQITKTELEVVLRECENALKRSPNGDVVEFGCHAGATSLFLQRLLKNRDRRLLVYDSFQGLPEKSKEDANAAGVNFKSGELIVSKKNFISNFKSAGLKLPIIHKAWFDELKSDQIPKEIVFAFLDGDFYNSILTSLRLVWPNLTRESIVLVHDYNRETLPGVEKAVLQFLANKKDAKIRVEKNIAIITKYKTKY